jgi:magnesium transporter
MNLEVIEAKKVNWYNITDIDQEGAGYLQKNFNFHELDMEDVLSKNQRSKIDEYEDYIFLLLHFPVFNEYSERIEISEVDIFVGKNYVVTISDGRILALNNLIEICKKDINNQKDYNMHNTGKLLYEILNSMYKAIYPLVDRLGWEISEIERDLFEEGDHESVKDRLRDIMMVKRNTMRFRRIINPARLVMISLENKKIKFISPSYEIYFDDIVDTIEKVRETLESYNEIVNALHETNEALINHRTNNVMKILTIFSVILLPLTFVTGLYGMNLMHLPLDAEPKAFWFIIIGMILLVFGMLWYFKRKQWL